MAKKVPFDPVLYLYDRVVPVYEFYVEESRRHQTTKARLLSAALLAASKVYHYREFLEPLYPRNFFSPDYMARECPDYRWVGDITNADKHGIRTKGNENDYIIKEISQIEETIVNTFFYVDGTENPRQFYPTQDLRILINPLPGKGPVRDLLDIVTNVLNYWTWFLVEKGFTDYRQTFRYTGDDVPSERKPLELVKIYPRIDGMFTVPSILRYHEPRTGKFGRWGFTMGQELKRKGLPKYSAMPVAENALNAKIYVSYTPPPRVDSEPYVVSLTFSPI